MIFKDALAKMDIPLFIETMDKWHVAESEQKEFLQFIKNLLEMEATPKTAAFQLKELDGEEKELSGDYSAVFVKDGQSYAIDFVPWTECLGFVVEEKTFPKGVTLEEFVFLILYDMSFDGFEQETRDERMDNLLSRIDSLKSEKD